MRTAAFLIIALIAAAFIIGCAKQNVQTTGTNTQPNTAGDAGAALDSQFDTYDTSFDQSAADTVSDQDLAAAAG